MRITKLEEEIKKAIFQHIALTKHLQDYVVFNRPQHKTFNEIIKSRKCSFSNWLEKSEDTKPYRQRDFFVSLQTIHKIFHISVEELITCIQQKKRHEAQHLMYKGGDYQNNLDIFIESLIQWLDIINKDRREERRKNAAARTKMNPNTVKGIRPKVL